MTHDLEFEAWASKVWNFGAGLGSEIVAQGLPQGHHRSRSTTRPASSALAYNVYRCWVSEYQALPDLDANANAVAIQHIKLENEGFERDEGVVEPQEPSFP